MTKIRIQHYMLTILVIGSIFLFGCKKEKMVYDNTTDSTVTDIDGNVYRIVRIGSQVWMAENLKVTRYRNGDAIPYCASDSAWFGLQGLYGCYCDYGNSPANGAIYGHLYNG